MTATLAWGFVSAGQDDAAAQQLVPVYKSADSGFFTLCPYKGFVFGGTYGGRVYRIEGGGMFEEAHFKDTESVYTIVTSPSQSVLLANLEREVKGPTVMRRIDAATAWESTGIGGSYPEDEKAMGLGGGWVLGNFVMATTPYVSPAKGYLWSSADGYNWATAPGFNDSVPMPFIEFKGVALTATTFGDKGNGLYSFNGSGWSKVASFPKDHGGGNAIVFGDSVIVAAESELWNFNASGQGVVVIDKPDGSFFKGLAVLKMPSGKSWAAACWSVEWRAPKDNPGSELWVSENGMQWSKYQTFVEGECWALTTLETWLVAGTRQEGGNGQVYAYKFCEDADGDGQQASVCGGTDCDDTKAGVHPGAAEVCNGLDDDCDGTVDEDQGSTSCGTGPCATTVQNCVGGAVQQCVPGAPGVETCDGIDNDCDGAVDEDLGSTTCGTGPCATTVQNCVGGVVQQCVPGAPGVETCDGTDNDCDGEVDESGGALCDDGVFCNGQEACAGAAGCVPGAAPCSDDGEFCNGTEACDEGSKGCYHSGDPCGIGESCDETADSCLPWPQGDDTGAAETPAGEDEASETTPDGDEEPSSDPVAGEVLVAEDGGSTPGDQAETDTAKDTGVGKDIPPAVGKGAGGGCSLSADGAVSPALWLLGFVLLLLVVSGSRRVVVTTGDQIPRRGTAVH